MRGTTPRGVSATFYGTLDRTRQKFGERKLESALAPEGAGGGASKSTLQRVGSAQREAT